MVRLASVSDVIGLPMPRLLSAKLVSVLYWYGLSTTFSTTEGPRLKAHSKATLEWFGDWREREREREKLCDVAMCDIHFKIDFSHNCQVHNLK